MADGPAAKKARTEENGVFSKCCPKLGCLPSNTGNTDECTRVCLGTLPSAHAFHHPAGHHQHCLVLDYGSQYTQLIARRIRENGVLSMLMPGDASLVRTAAVGTHARRLGRGGRAPCGRQRAHTG